MHENSSSPKRKIEELDGAVIRFAGDSGDGMQLVGNQFTAVSAIAGDDVATLPDYPSEIRAPAGTVAGVSGFQLSFGNAGIYTPGDQADVLFAMNPAALKTNLNNVKKAGLIVINEDSFVDKNFEKAGFAGNPLEGPHTEPTLKDFHVVRVNIAEKTREALSGTGLLSKQIDRCKNFYALGMACQLFNRPKEYTLNWLTKKFQTKPELVDANIKSFEAGWRFAETSTQFAIQYTVRKKNFVEQPGTYRHVTGNQAAALGLLTAAQLAGRRLFLGSYPITPATDILHELSKHKQHVTVFQAEDEIAAIGSAIGASFGGALAATTTSGPGLSLKTEFMNLAVITELPLVIVDVQRAGPSTGLPTKSEQSDLFQALWGRHGESPMVVLAASSPRDCYDIMIEAARLAIKYMTPVIALTDGYLGNGSEVWRIPAINELPSLAPPKAPSADKFLPYERNPETLARPWVAAGTAGYEHRLGGLEKEENTGFVSHDPANHEKMCRLRAEKVARIARDIPPLSIEGDAKSDILVLGWGSTRGVIRQAVEKLNNEGFPVAMAHLRHINPLPANLGDILKQYKKVLIPENNLGQLWYLLRAEYLVNCQKLCKIQGLPFRADEIEAELRRMK